MDNLKSGARGLDAFKPTYSAIEYLAAAAGGALAASGLGAVGQTIAGAALGAVDSISAQYREYKNGDRTEFSGAKLAADVVTGALFGGIGGNGASSIKSGAGGFKQMLSLGGQTIHRTKNALLNRGISGYLSEVGPAAAYYLKNTKIVTKQLLWGRNAVSRTLSIGYSAIPWD